MYYTLLALSGALIAVMVTLNGMLAQMAGIALSLIFIHIAGLVGIHLILYREKKYPPVKIPLYLFLPGFIGVILTWANIYCVNTLGVTLMLALGLLGQLTASFVYDITGLPGLEKRPVTLQRVLTLITAVLGCLIMIDPSRLLSFAVAAAVLSGVIVASSTSLNASLGTLVGPLHSTRINYITGLIGCFIFLGITGITGGEIPSLNILRSIPWYILAGGGLCGVAVVSGINFSLPHISILYSTVILLAAQIITGYFMDLVRHEAVDYRVVTGAAVMLAGLCLRFIIPGKRENTGKAVPPEMT